MRVIVSKSVNPAYNLALEEYLFGREDKTCVLFYRNAPSVIIGSNQAVLNEVNVDFCETNNIPVIRRKSGGGAVYHDLGNVNYSFFLNRSMDGLALNDDFLQQIADWLADIGIAVRIGSRKDLWLSATEKVGGTASRVQRNRIMHHGTLLFHADLINLNTALSPVKVDDSIKATKSVRSITGNIAHEYAHLFGDTSEFLEKLAFQAAKRVDCELLSNEDFSQSEIMHFELTYIDKDWNFRK